MRASLPSVMSTVSVIITVEECRVELAPKKVHGIVLGNHRELPKLPSNPHSYTGHTDCPKQQVQQCMDSVLS